MTITVNPGGAFVEKLNLSSMQNQSLFSRKITNDSIVYFFAYNRVDIY